MKYLLSNIPKINTPEHLPRDKVVYLHRRESDGIPFYVGIGVDGRQNKVGNFRDGTRNDDWHEVYNEHGRIVQLLFTELIHWHAKAIEVVLIFNYRRVYGKYREGGFITNLSDGGEGCSGYKYTQEQIANFIKIRNTPEHKEKVSATTKAGMQREEVIRKCRDAAVARWLNDDYRKNNSGENAPQFGMVGKLHNRFQGYSVGKNKNQFIILEGDKEMKDCGFSQGCISSCITGRKNFKTHKGFTWTRHTTINPDDFIGLEPYNQLSAERLQNAKNS